ncbi:hypothetical protein AQUCO_05800126v1 [Aquilegia coerulea]|uniref:DUF7866 domain-containing protein n=1 Tax=Aquilegia coerulea TaxID=218851 RepID=A0A2G5CEX4_AQUCA|nr:hypothetical protein AQUCO_05800126v1 [Aquilegia coerulea]
MFNSGVSFFSYFLLIFIAIIASIHSARFVHGVLDNVTMVPLIEPKMMESVILNDTRRRLRNFQICALCTCCGGAKGVCIASPCCYAINCNIPNRPFGWCSFTPRKCNCFGCHL